MVHNSIDKSSAEYKLESPLFEFLSNSEISRLQKNSFEVNYNAGESIIKQGAPVTHIIVIKSGLQKLFIEHLNQSKLVIKILAKNDTAGISGLYVDRRHYFSLTAVESSTISFIETDIFLTLIQENVHFANAIIELINMRYVQLYNKMLSITQKTVNSRVAETLLYLSKNIYRTNTFQTSLSRDDFAGMAATSNESISRAFKYFREKKIINCEKKYFEIIKPEQLEKISHLS